MPDGFHYYSVFGLTLLSWMPLPDLPEADRLDAHDVEIVEGRVPTLGPEARALPGLVVDDEWGVLDIKNVARYGMEAGRRIVVEPYPAASERDVRLYLLGSALGFILHQRVLLPLHANSIVVGDRAVAFAGPPGAGKSTMAAYLHDRGFPILSDDVSVVRFDEGGAPWVQPGLPRLRLWREAAEAFGRDVSDYDLSFEGFDKYNLPIEAPANRPVLLGKVYILNERTDEGGGELVERLSGARAVGALMANIYRGGYLPLLEGGRATLEACVALAGQVGIYRVRRVWGFDALDDQMAKLIAHASEHDTQP